MCFLIVVCYGAVCCIIWFSFCVLCSLMYIVVQLCVTVQFVVWSDAVVCMLCCCLLFCSWIMCVLSMVGDANLWLTQTNVTLYKNPGSRLFTRGQPPLQKEAGIVLRSLGKGRYSRILHSTAFWSVLLSDCSIFKFLVCISKPLCLFSWT